MYEVTVEYPPEDDAFFMILKIHTEDGVNEYEDMGEPEDNTFDRDYSWIKTELERAYQLGLRDGKAELTQGRPHGYCIDKGDGDYIMERVGEHWAICVWEDNLRMFSNPAYKMKLVTIVEVEASGDE